MKRNQPPAPELPKLLDPDELQRLARNVHGRGILRMQLMGLRLTRNKIAAKSEELRQQLATLDRQATEYADAYAACIEQIEGALREVQA